MRSFLEQLPKAELHVHLEGTLEPEQLFELAQRNNIELPYHTVKDVLAAYDFHDLPSFLAIYYRAMDVLRTEADFYNLAYQYFERAAKQNVIYCEPFFDPQPHTIRGVELPGTALQSALRRCARRPNYRVCTLRGIGQS